MVAVFKEQLKMRKLKSSFGWFCNKWMLILLHFQYLPGYVVRREGLIIQWRSHHTKLISKRQLCLFRYLMLTVDLKYRYENVIVKKHVYFFIFRVSLIWPLSWKRATPYLPTFWITWRLIRHCILVILHFFRNFITGGSFFTLISIFCFSTWVAFTLENSNSCNLLTLFTCMI